MKRPENSRRHSRPAWAAAALLALAMASASTSADNTLVPAQSLSQQQQIKL